MTTSTIADARSAVSGMRAADDHASFTEALRHFMGALGALIDAPQKLPPAEIAEAVTLGDAAAELVEGHIHSDRHAQKLAGTVYEIRRRLELLERWRQYYEKEQHG